MHNPSIFNPSLIPAPISHERPMTLEEAARFHYVSNEKARDIIPKDCSHPRYKKNRFNIQFPTLANAYCDIQLHALFHSSLQKQGHSTVTTYYYGSQPQNFIDPTIIPHDRDVCSEVRTSNPEVCCKEKENILISFIINHLSELVRQQELGNILSESEIKALPVLQLLLKDHKRHIECHPNSNMRSELQNLIVDEYFFQRALFRDEKTKEIVGSLLSLNEHDMRLEFRKDARPSNISIVDSLQVDLFTGMMRAINHGQPYPLNDVIDAILQRRYHISDDNLLKHWIYPLARKSLSFEVFEKNIASALKDMAVHFPLYKGKFRSKESYENFLHRITFPSQNLMGRRLYYLQLFSFLNRETADTGAKSQTDTKLHVDYSRHIAAIWLNSMEKDQKDFEEKLFCSFAKLIHQYPEDTKTYLGCIFGLFMAWIGEKKEGVSLSLVPQTRSELQWRFTFREASKVHQYVLEKERTLSSLRRFFLKCKEKITQLQNKEEYKIIHETLQAVDNDLIKAIIAQEELKKLSAEATQNNLEELNDLFSWLAKHIDRTYVIKERHLESLFKRIKHCNATSIKYLDEMPQRKNILTHGLRLFCKKYEEHISNANLPAAFLFCQEIQKLGIEICHKSLFPKWQRELIPLLKPHNSKTAISKLLTSQMADSLENYQDQHLQDYFISKSKLLTTACSEILPPEAHDKLQQLSEADFSHVGEIVSQFISVMVEIDLELAETFFFRLHKKSAQPAKDAWLLLKKMHQSNDNNSALRVYVDYINIENSQAQTSLTAKKAALMLNILQEPLQSNAKETFAYIEQIELWMPKKNTTPESENIISKLISRVIEAIEKNGFFRLSQKACQLLLSIHRNTENHPHLVEYFAKSYSQSLFPLIESCKDKHPKLAHQTLRFALSFAQSKDLFKRKNSNLIGRISAMIAQSDNANLWVAGAVWLYSCPVNLSKSDKMQQAIASLCQKLLSIDEGTSKELQMVPGAINDLCQKLIAFHSPETLWTNLVNIVSEEAKTQRDNYFSFVVRSISSLEGLDKEGKAKLLEISSASVAINRQLIVKELFIFACHYKLELVQTLFTVLQDSAEATWSDFLMLCKSLSKRGTVTSDIADLWRHNTVEEEVKVSAALAEAEDICVLLNKGFCDSALLLKRLVYHFGQLQELNKKEVVAWFEIYRRVVQEYLPEHAEHDIIGLSHKLCQIACSKELLKPFVANESFFNVLRSYLLTQENKDIDYHFLHQLKLYLKDYEPFSSECKDNTAKLINSLCIAASKQFDTSSIRKDHTIGHQLFRHLIACGLITSERWTETVDETCMAWARSVSRRHLLLSFSIAQKRKYVEELAKENIFKVIPPTSRSYSYFYKSLIDQREMKYCHEIQVLFPALGWLTDYNDPLVCNVLINNFDFKSVNLEFLKVRRLEYKPPSRANESDKKLRKNCCELLMKWLAGEDINN